MTGARATVFLHVGAPKTGTSFVQDLLFHNRDALAEQGILYPADRFDAHFLAALDLMDLDWGGLEKEAVGAWDRLAAQVRGWDGSVIISHEILARASRAQVRRALDSFGEAEVHVVLSARDLVRQIPAEWQENVKHRRAIGYGDFLERVTDPARAGRLASWFWGVQEIPDILHRWGSTLPVDRVHVVTVPKPGAPRDLLWERFAGLFGIDPLEVERGETRANPSLGVPESALLRRVNERVNGGVLPNHRYRELVRELLAHRSLSTRTGSGRLALPPEARAWAVDLSEAWIKALDSRGYDVVGTLDDLRPDADAAPFVDPDQPDEHQDLQTAGALAGDDVDVVERVDQHRAGLGRELLGRDQRIVHAVAVEPDVGAVAAGRSLLRDRRTLGHEHGGLDPEQLRGEGDALGVVAGAGRDHPAGPLLLREARHPQVGAPDLERAGALEVLALEVDRPAGGRGEPPRLLHRRLDRHPAEELAGLLDVGQGRDGSHSRQPRAVTAATRK